VKKILIAAIVILAACIVARLRYTSSREMLAAQRAAVGESWKAVDSALHDHADLLPVLASKIKIPEKLAAKAGETIVEARGVLGQDRPAPEKIQAYGRLTLESARLLLAAEQTPALRTDPDFQRLKEQLTDTDNRVLVARRKYNEALERYNASLKVFPHNVVAALSGYARDDAYFPTAPDVRTSTKE
jgi:LemA protein